LGEFEDDPWGFFGAGVEGAVGFRAADEIEVGFRGVVFASAADADGGFGGDEVALGGGVGRGGGEEEEEDERFHGREDVVKGGEVTMGKAKGWRSGVAEGVGAGQGEGMSGRLEPSDSVRAFLRDVRGRGVAVLRLGGAGAMRERLGEMEREAEADVGLEAMLREWHAEASEDLGGEVLAFDGVAARAGARVLFRAAWCLLVREVSAEEVEELLDGVEMPAPCAAAQWSVDVVLRWLPDVERLARGLAPGDPLIGALVRVAERWPLSGAGMRREVVGRGMVDGAAWEAMRGHEGLWQLFLDRVMVSRAEWWLADEEVRAAAERSLGEWRGETAVGLRRGDFPV